MRRNNSKSVQPVSKINPQRLFSTAMPPGNSTPRQFPAVIQLSSLNGENGFKIYGESAGDLSGNSVSIAGDINGDGYADLIIGAPEYPGYPSTPGRTYVVFGGMKIGNSVLALANLNGTDGFKLDGEYSGDRSGWSISAAGDINGDGYGDVLIGASGYPEPHAATGRSYVFFGGKSVGNNGVIALSSLNGANGFKIDGELPGDQSGCSVSGAGDINGDGYDDLLIGAWVYPGYPEAGKTQGRSYVVFGGAKVGNSGVIALSSLNGFNGFKLDGEFIGDESGYTVSGVGDVNEDGYADLIIGSPGALQGKGRSYVVFGGDRVGNGGIIALSSLNGTNGFKLDGESGGGVGSLSTAGDINGDGYNDIFIGAPGYSKGKGRSYVIFGGPGVGSSGLITLAGLNGTVGFKLDGENNGDVSGSSVSAARDINGDGYADLIIGAYGYPGGAPFQKGRSYVVFGGPGVGNSGLVVLASLNGSTGFKIDGENNGQWSGYSVSAMGDFNGDGYADILIGSPEDEIGRSYVIFSNGTFSNGSQNLDVKLITGLSVTVGALLFLLSCYLYKRYKKQHNKPIFPKKENAQPLIHSQNRSLKGKEKDSGSDSDSEEDDSYDKPSSSQLINEAGEMKISLNISYEDLEFDKKDKLGAGTYGTVYKGAYKFNQVAIKKLHAEHLSENALEELKREAGILGTMRSDYIVRLNGICLEPPNFCLVMELMPKGSLYGLLQNSPELPFSIRYQIGRDVGYGLYHLHEKNILHLDLKSLNVLLDDRFRAKITDFGLSKMKSEMSTMSEAKGVGGTLAWMAPELFAKKPAVSSAVDIYAFGMVLWELIIKPYRTPFQSMTSTTMITAKLTRGDKQETIPKSCAPKMAKLIRTCWRESHKRPSAQLVAKNLTQLFEAEKKKSVPVPSVGRVMRDPLQSEVSGYAPNLMSGKSAASVRGAVNPSLKSTIPGYESNLISK